MQTLKKLVSLESGSLYPIALIICLVFQLRGSPASMNSILVQIVVKQTVLIGSLGQRELTE